MNNFFERTLRQNWGPGCFKDENKNIKPFDCYRKHIKTLEGPEDNFFIPLLELSRYANSYEELQKPNNHMQFYDVLELPRLDWFLLFIKHVAELSDSNLLKKIESEQSSEGNINNILELYPTFRKKHSEVLSSEDINNWCNILESYIVRKWLLDRSYKYCYKQIDSFFSNKIDGKPNMNDFVQFLSKTWPEQEEVEKVLRGGC